MTKMTIFISGLRVYAFHGVLPQERLVGGDYLVDVRVDYSHSLATESDRVEDTLDYSRLHHLIDEEMAIPSALLEHVAGRITRRVQRDFPEMSSVWVRITKVNPPMGAACQGAGVELTLDNPRQG